MHNFIVGLFLLLFAGLIIGIIGGLFYLIYLPFKKNRLTTGKLTERTSRKINKTYIIFLSICSLILFAISYNDVFPNDDFYTEEFTLYTGIKLPASADIKEKDASYPDFFGDFSAVAIIELNSNDYDKLKKDISQLKNFQVDTTSQKIGVTDIFETLAEKIKKSDIEIVFLKSDAEWFKLAFLKDGRTIILEKQSS